MTIKRKDFVSLQKFIDRAQYLKRRVQALVNDLGNTAVIYMVLNGVKEYQFHTFLTRMMKDKKLKWEDLISELSDEAAKEAHDMNLLNVKNPNNNKMITTTSDNPKSGPRRHPYYAPCKCWHSGGDNACWKLHPELVAAKKKKEEETTTSIAMTPTASIASVKFQSGLSGMMVHNKLFAAIRELPSYQLSNDSMIMDSGASDHTFNNKKWFTHLVPLPKPLIFASSNGGDIATTHSGMAIFNVKLSNGELVEFECHGVYSPDSPCNLLSTGNFKNDGAIVDNFNNRLVTKDRKIVLAELCWANNVQAVRNVLPPPIKNVNLATISYNTMHKRLLHTNKETVLKICEQAGIQISRAEARQYHCEACKLGKATNFILKSSESMYHHPLQMVHVDLIEHMVGHAGLKYTLHFIDCWSGHHWIKFMKTKEDVYTKLLEWVNQIEVQTGLKVQEIGLDGGPEFGQGTKLFTCLKLREWCKSGGKILSPTTPHTPWYNAKSKCAGGSVTSYARTALIAASLSPSLWPFAEETAATVLNLLPSKSTPERLLPQQTWLKGLKLPEGNKPPYIKHLCTFGCTAYVYVKLAYQPKKDKMVPKAKKGKLLGYNNLHGRIYWVYLPAEGKVVRAGAVKFHEENKEIQPIEIDELINHEAILEDRHPEDEDYKMGFSYPLDEGKEQEPIEKQDVIVKELIQKVPIGKAQSGIVTPEPSPSPPSAGVVDSPFDDIITPIQGEVQSDYNTPNNSEHLDDDSDAPDDESEDADDDSKIKEHRPDDSGSDDDAAVTTQDLIGLWFLT